MSWFLQWGDSCHAARFIPEGLRQSAYTLNMFPRNELPCAPGRIHATLALDSSAGIAAHPNTYHCKCLPRRTIHNHWPRWPSTSLQKYLNIQISTLVRHGLVGREAGYSLKGSWDRSLTCEVFVSMDDS